MSASAATATVPTHNTHWKDVACECPVRILQSLHEHGRYVHCVSPRFPGKILCLPADNPLLDVDGVEYTVAQERALLALSGREGEREAS